MSLDRAIARFDIVDFVIGHGGTEEQAGEWTLTCPLCGKEKLIVNERKRTWHCWVCEEYGPADARGRRKPIKGAGGLISLYALLEKVDTQTAANRILLSHDFDPMDVSAIPTAELATGIYDSYRPASAIAPPEALQPIYATLPYMLKRGISLEDAHDFGLGWCSHGRYANRLIFPVWERGQLVYFQGRAMWEMDDYPMQPYVKALNPGRQDGAAVSSDVLMNLDVAREFPRVVITEGPIDCIKAGRSAVCTFGKKISPMQIAKLMRAGVRAVDLMWDGPSEREPHGAWPEMFHFAPLLASLFDLRLVFLPQGDPGIYTHEQLAWYREHSSRHASDLSGIAKL